MARRKKYPRFPRINRIEVWLVMILVGAIAYGISNWHESGGGEDWHIPRKEAGDIAGGAEVREVAPVAMPATGNTVRFVSYNVCNYFISDVSKRTGGKTTIKQDASRDAVADTVRLASPDIVGLCEVGGKDALKDLQGRLKKRGCHLPYSLILERAGEDRCLAILSKYPLGGNRSQSDIPLRHEKRKMLRGILDVSINIPDGRKFRFVGIHLKSKKDMDGTAENTRRLEAHALREYLVAHDDGLPLIVFGDFNDSPNSPTLQIVMGARKTSDGLRRLVPRDSRKETWTIRYSEGDAYFSYDHLLINNRMQKRMGRGAKCGIIDNVEFLRASDHRALWLELK